MIEGEGALTKEVVELATAVGAALIPKPDSEALLFECKGVWEAALSGAAILLVYPPTFTHALRFCLKPRATVSTDALDVGDLPGLGTFSILDVPCVCIRASASFAPSA